MITVSKSTISAFIGIIIQKYLLTDNSLCIFWNDRFRFDADLSLQNFTQIVSIKVADNVKQYDNFVEILNDLLENSTCERFIVTEDNIALFQDAFTNITYGLEKRLKFHKFLLIYSNQAGDLKDHPDMKHHLINFLPNFLVAQLTDDATIDLWTKQFAGQTRNVTEQLIHLDTYFAANQTFRHNSNLYPDKVQNLMGKVLILGTFDYRPFVITDEQIKPNVLQILNDSHKQPLFVDGTEARFLLHFCQRHNCTVELYVQEDKDWGTAYWNLSGEGLLGALNEGKCEFAIDALYLWRREYLHFDISMPLSRSGVTNIVPVPQPKISFLLPLQPFSLQLWLAVCVCLCGEFICLLVTYWLQYNKTREQHRHRRIEDSLEYGIGVALRIFLSQGFNEICKDLPSRIILFSCLIIDLVIDSVYDGGLASILTLPSFEEPTDTIERLVRHHMIWTGTTNNWLFSMEKSEDPLIRKVIDLYETDSMESLAARSLTEDMGFVIERLPFGHYSVPEYISREAARRYQVMKEDLYYEYCVAFVPKLWPYLENFDKLVLSLQASGLVQYWEWDNTVKYLDNYIQDVLRGNSNPEEDGVKKLDLANFTGIILIWIFGAGVSCIVFLAEVLWYRTTSRDLVVLM